MAEYIVDWTGIGTTLVHLAKTKPPFLWPKALRALHRKERIIRCRNCKYSKEFGSLCSYRKPYYFPVSHDGFCSCGEPDEQA